MFLGNINNHKFILLKMIKLQKGEKEWFMTQKKTNNKQIVDDSFILFKKYFNFNLLIYFELVFLIIK